MTEMICQWILKAAVVRQRLETQLKEGMYACVYIYIYISCFRKCARYLSRLFFFQQVVARDWCIGG